MSVGIIQITLLVILIIWIGVLVDILRNQFSDNNKLIWLLVVLFLPLVGPLLYLMMGRNQKIKTEKNSVLSIVKTFNEK